jgi:hypothetical protein
VFGVPLIIGAPLIIAEQDDSAELWREPHDARDGVHDTDTPPCEIHTVCTLYGVSHREGGCLYTQRKRFGAAVTNFAWRMFACENPNDLL